MEDEETLSKLKPQSCLCNLVLSLKPLGVMGWSVSAIFFVLLFWAPFLSFRNF